MKKNIKIEKLDYIVSSHFFGVSFFLLFLLCSSYSSSQIFSLRSVKKVILTDPTFLVKADFKESGSYILEKLYIRPESGKWGFLSNPR